MPAGTEQQPSFGDEPRTLNPLSPHEIAEANASFLTKDVGDIQKGSAAASQAVLSEVHEMQLGGYLPEVAKEIEKSGNAKVVYGTNGELQHIVFNDADGKPPVDIDLQHESINGQSSEQLREASVRQAKDYIAAGLADPNMTDASGKPLSSEGQKVTNQLVGALLDGNSDTMTQAAQQIMKDPTLTKSVEDVLNRIQFPSTISFAKDEHGQPYIKANSLNEFQSMIIPASGPARAAEFDYTGKEVPSASLDLKTAMRAASDWALTEDSSQIQSSQGYLSMVERLPKDGFTNMKHLEAEYTSRHDAQDNVKLGALVAKELQKLTAAQRAEVLEGTPTDMLKDSCD